MISKEFLNVPSTSDRREMEKKLLDRVRAAQKAYFDAAAEHRNTIEAKRKGRVEAKSDGIHLLHIAHRSEHRALESYSTAVKELAECVLGHKAPNPGPSAVETLTPREKEVLGLIVDGLSSRLIAARLGISFKTAVCHRHRIMKKLDVHNAAGLLKYVLSSRVILPNHDAAPSEIQLSGGSSSLGSIPSRTRLRH